MITMIHFTGISGRNYGGSILLRFPAKSQTGSLKPFWIFPLFQLSVKQKPYIKRIGPSIRSLNVPEFYSHQKNHNESDREPAWK